MGNGQLDFVTLGMFIIDEIHFKHPKPPEVDILGGAGSWSVLGARLFRPPPFSKAVSWIVHRGSDFPAEIERQIELWHTSCCLVDTPERLTTRGWNSYGDEEIRAFEYLTPKLRIDHNQLSEEQLLAKCFHLICTPRRCVDLVKNVSALRQKVMDARSILPNQIVKPIFVWEPVPDSCQPDELQNALQALQYIDIISPNHQELAALFGQTARTQDPAEDATRLEGQCRELFMHGFKPGTGAVVVRCGEHGCFWMTGAEMKSGMHPAWHQPTQTLCEDFGTSENVIDPTGGGNAFLGGFCVGLLDAQSEKKALNEAFAEAALCGIVAASFAIEQVGMPVLTHTHGEERWNEDSVQRRVQVMKSFYQRVGFKESM